MTYDLAPNILRGIPMVQQGRFVYYRNSDESACAIGTALLAIGQIACVAEGGESPATYFPVLGQLTTHPLTGHTTTVGDVIADLNDIHGWSRERISAWVSGIESAQSSQPASLELVGV